MTDEPKPQHVCLYTKDGQCSSIKKGEAFDAQRCYACMLASWIDFARDVLLYLEKEKEYSPTLRKIREKYTRMARKSITAIIENGFDSEHWSQILDLMTEMEKDE